MTKQYGLLWCFPCGPFASGNSCLAEVEASSFGEAIELLQKYCLVPLSSSGHAKDGIYSYVVCESFAPSTYRLP